MSMQLLSFNTKLLILLWKNAISPWKWYFFLNSRTYTISVRTKTNGVPVAIVATISKVWGRENIFWKALEMYRPLQNGSDGVTKWWACAKWMVWGYYSAQLIQFTYNQLLSVVVVDVTAHAMYIIFCSMYNN